MIYAKNKIYNMKQKSILSIFLFFLFSIAFVSCDSHQEEIGNSRVVKSFNNDWKFIQEEVEGAEALKFNDKNWQVLNVPHDWSLESEFNQDNLSARGGAYVTTGIGWYRKEFQLPKSAEGRRVWINFGALMANSDVYINGHHLGHRPYGYVEINYELTDYINFGKTNVISVRLDNSKQPSSRWYTGGGIYRKVNLIIKEDVFVEHNGVFVTTPKVQDNVATVNIKNDVVNGNVASEIILKSIIVDANGNVVAEKSTSKQIKANEKVTIEQELEVNSPELWSLKTPVLYTNNTELWVGDVLKDNFSTNFGIRTFEFDSRKGFILNGEYIRLKGACLHQDGGALGSAVPSAIWEDRLLKLKSIGINAIRTSHHPFAPEFFELCDKLGFFVMNESFDTWRATKKNADFGYQQYFDEWWKEDTRAMVLADRNHPSIFITSVGNEIRDNLNNEKGFETYKMQRDFIHSLDGTRPVTMALFRPNEAMVYSNGFAEMMDVVGQNYREAELAVASEKNPHWKVTGTENGHSRQSYLVWRDNPSIAGHFLWTGYDYLGEADWPEISHDFGLFDRAGFTKPRTYERMSWWSDEPMVHIFRREHHLGQGGLVDDWTPTDFDTYDEASLEIYSNCDEVELFHNDISLGNKKRAKDHSPFFFRLNFKPGTIKAVGKIDGKVVASHEMKTAESPAKITLSPSKSILTNNWDDVSVVTIQLVDKEGVYSPNIERLLTFSIVGNGEIVAVDNGALDSHESFLGNQRRTHRGQAIVVVRATADGGNFTLNVEGAGLENANYNFTIQK